MDDKRFMPRDLHDKIVDYQIRSDDGHIYAGEGKLVVRVNPKGMFVSILVEAGLLQDNITVQVQELTIPGDQSHLLVRNPQGSKNPFSFKAL